MTKNRTDRGRYSDEICPECGGLFRFHSQEDHENCLKWNSSTAPAEEPDRKKELKILNFQVYADELCKPDEITIYSYGRIFVHPSILSFDNPGRIVLKLERPRPVEERPRFDFDCGCPMVEKTPGDWITTHTMECRKPPRKWQGDNKYLAGRE